MKVLISDNLSEECIKRLKQENLEVTVRSGLDESELINIIPAYDALIVRSSTKVTKNVINAADKLKVIGRAGTGVDNIDIEAATKKGIKVMNTPTGNVNSAAEHTIGMILALSRHIHHSHHSLKNKREWDRKRFVGVEVKGKTLGIIGLGRVGKLVARIACQGLQMKVIGFDPYVNEEEIAKLGINLVMFDELLKSSDYITLHVPLNDETRGMINEREFRLMKHGVRVINVARGGVINEHALANSIKSGKVAGAAIDVWENEPPFDSPLLELDEVLVTPHLGASTKEAQINVARDIADQIIDFLKNGICRNAVN